MTFGDEDQRKNNLKDRKIKDPFLEIDRVSAVKPNPVPKWQNLLEDTKLGSSNDVIKQILPKKRGRKPKNANQENTKAQLDNKKELKTESTEIVPVKKKRGRKSSLLKSLEEQAETCLNPEEIMPPPLPTEQKLEEDIPIPTLQSMTNQALQQQLLQNYIQNTFNQQQLQAQLLLPNTQPSVQQNLTLILSSLGYNFSGEIQKQMENYIFTLGLQQFIEKSNMHESFKYLQMLGRNQIKIPDQLQLQLQQQRQLQLQVQLQLQQQQEQQQQSQILLQQQQPIDQEMTVKEIKRQSQQKIDPLIMQKLNDMMQQPGGLQPIKKKRGGKQKTLIEDGEQITSNNINQKKVMSMHPNLKALKEEEAKRIEDEKRNESFYLHDNFWRILKSKDEFQDFETMYTRKSIESRFKILSEKLNVYEQQLRIYDLSKSNVLMNVFRSKKRVKEEQLWDKLLSHKCSKSREPDKNENLFPPSSPNPYIEEEQPRESQQLQQITEQNVIAD